MKIKYHILLVVFVMTTLILLSACSAQDTAAASVSSILSTEMKVHFIDVGQGDCTLIQLQDGRNILIDGGNKADFATITEYLQKEKVKSIDYLIATHPHEDHIGSLPSIIKAYNIGEIYMPKASSNTKLFEDLLLSIKEKGYKINEAAGGVKIIDEEDLNLSVLAPNSSDYDDLNNYSVVAKLTYKNTSFLFTGDAEDISEREMLKRFDDIKIDVIKIGHHGGRTSSTKEFLQKAAPKYAVISVGKDNDYGHPHAETLERLNSQNLQVFRTDLLGSIVIKTDGNKLTINKQPITVVSDSKQNAAYYIGNINSKVFHVQSCTSLPKPENRIKLQSKLEAQQKGYTPCQKCKP